MSSGVRKYSATSNGVVLVFLELFADDLGKTLLLKILGKPDRRSNVLDL
jgi:hypothetical protein